MLNDNIKDFNRIMDFAHLVIKETSTIKYCEPKKHPLIDLVKLVGKKLQTKYLTELLYTANEEIEAKLPNFTQDEILINPYSSITHDKTFRDLMTEVDTDMVVSLASDLVLPRPWNRKRLINCVSYIGEGRKEGAWKEDNSNHNVQVWLPLGIVWVTGGNHSIATGIIQGQGFIKPTNVYDISNVYDFVRCNGSNFILNDGSPIATVKNVEMAAIFEIGRLIKEHAIPYY